MKAVTKIILVGCAVTAAGFVAFFGWTAFGDRSETGFHCPSVPWLPQSASDISFYRNSNIGNVQAYEFQISRPDFEALARERGWNVKPMKQEVSIIRYTQCLPSAHIQRTEPFHAMSSSGLFYEDRRPNGGGISVLYDDVKSMAYVFSSNR